MPSTNLAFRNRIGSIDLLRGIIMVIMALDHVRDFFHTQSFVEDPLSLRTTTPWLYFTRWITHFCAPNFVFLAGVSAFLIGLRKDKKALSVFLVKRGFWLILVEVFIVTLFITFDPLYHIFVFQVIWAIGASMVIMGLVVRLPYKWIFIIGASLVLFHNLLDYPEQARNYQVGFFWNMMHSGHDGPSFFNNSRGIVLIYPLIPWPGIMMLGYCAGKLFTPDFGVERRRKWLLGLGGGMIAMFMILRLINAYGDPQAWASQRDTLHSFFSFMNVQKYPPSLMFFCATVGPALIALALLEGIKNKLTDFFTVFGRVPFFYYVVHFFVIHLLAVIIFFVEGYGKKDILPNGTPFLFRPLHFGFGLAGVYIIWVGLILFLYPICKWYNKYKSTHSQWWLSYL